MIICESVTFTVASSFDQVPVTMMQIAGMGLVIGAMWLLVRNDAVDFARLGPDYLEGRCPVILRNLLEVVYAYRSAGWFIPGSELNK